jgi:hypothetical protein
VGWRSLRGTFLFVHHRRMPKPLDTGALLSSAAMVARKAETYSPEIYVIDLAELRQIIWEMEQAELNAG